MQIANNNINESTDNDDNIRKKNNDRTVKLEAQHTDALYTFQRALTLLRVLAQHVVISLPNIISHNILSKSHNKQKCFSSTEKLTAAIKHTKQNENV